jgi:hypothetical protein
MTKGMTFNKPNKRFQTENMAAYNDLPTDLTKNIFTYLRQERRQPPHADAIQKMIDYIEDGIEIYDEEREQINVHERVWCPYAHIKTDNYANRSLFVDDAMCTNVWEEWANEKYEVQYELATRWFVNIIEARYDPNEQHAWVDEPLEKMYEMDMPPDEICVPIGGWSGRGIEV